MSKTLYTEADKGTTHKLINFKLYTNAIREVNQSTGDRICRSISILSIDAALRKHFSNEA